MASMPFGSMRNLPDAMGYGQRCGSQRSRGPGDPARRGVSRVEAMLLGAEGRVWPRLPAAAVRTLQRHRWLAKFGVGRDAPSSCSAGVVGHGRARLTPRRLAAVLARDSRRCGYLATRWTVPLLTHYLASQEGIAISARTLRRRLHEAGYRWKRPRHVYAGRATHLAQKKGLWSGA